MSNFETKSAAKTLASSISMDFLHMHTNAREPQVFWILVCTFWPLLMLSSWSLRTVFDFSQPTWHLYVENLLCYLGASITTRMIVMYFRQHSFRNMLILVFLTCLCWTGLEMCLDLLVFNLTGTIIEPDRYLGFIFGYGLSEFPIFLAFAAIYISLVENLVVQAQNLDLARAQALASGAQLKMLRYQLNPHFLFNTLNAISSLIMDDKARAAEGMIIRLSRFLRYSLDKDQAQKISLEEEIGAQKLYLEIEEVRFGDRLSTRFDIGKGLGSALVPSMILQPLIENSIKYAIASMSAGGEITIRANRKNHQLKLIVTDNGPGLPEIDDDTSTGVGLANTEQRLRVMYGDNATFTYGNRPQGGFEAQILLPFETTEGL